MAPKYIDNTGLFRDILKESQNREDIKPDKNRILNKRKEKDPLEVQAHLIIEHTTQLKCFLSENRGEYLAIFIMRNYTYTTYWVSHNEVFSESSTISKREHPHMTSDDFWSFLTYLPTLIR